jgi:uncharacterized membrane protein
MVPAAGQAQISFSYANALVKQWSFVMPDTVAKIAFVLLLSLATPAVSFAQTARTAGAAGSGNIPISGIAPGPANIGGLNNVTVDPSGIGNASKIAPLPPPRITVPVVPQFK